MKKLVSSEVIQNLDQLMIDDHVQKLLCQAAKLRRLQNLARILRLLTNKRKLEAMKKLSHAEKTALKDV